MPTYNRRAFIPHAIRYFLRQDYPNKELIILDDGDDKVSDLIPDRANIHYQYLPSKITLGEKLNRACEMASGDIIANWDDDDWYAPWRLSYQRKALQQDGIDVCGINQLLYYDLQKGDCYLYSYPKEQRIWLLGSSLFFSRTAWEQNPFAEINVGMDGLFVWATPEERVQALKNYAFSVHMIHPKNVSPKQTKNSWWHAHSAEAVKSIMGEDWSIYRQWARPKVEVPKPHATPTDKLKNILACLVHEKPDCVLDLVKNLRYYHPDSTILLYNGGTDQSLLAEPILTRLYGAIIHPSPRPQPYGYLHGFAFDCLQYAVDNLDFDTLTIVDSDQLSIRSDYEDFLARYLAAYPNAGLLSVAPERVHQAHTHHHIAQQAFREYQLWKPYLDTVPDGEDKFVHWTFWPATVFTASAAKALMELYKENELVQNIIKHSSIWASEEIFFPTLVRLLGFDIIKHPCNYAYTKFRQPLNQRQLNDALADDNTFWLHPVSREFLDPIRKAVREQSWNYRLNEKSSPRLTDYVDAVQSVNGWLSKPEAMLLLRYLYQCLSEKPEKQEIVEIGSYHGKATILIGKLLKDYFPAAHIHAIDPHDGLLGAADQGLQQFPPSLAAFTANIQREDLQDQVSIHHSVSTEVEWQKDITFLLIDGLHDYEHVASDFYHFEPWLVAGTMITFHDYAEYFPGVKAFVHELLAKNTYQLVDSADTMIIIKKVNADSD